MIDKLWVKIAITIGFLTLVGVLALLADDLFQVPRVAVALGLAVAGIASIIATKRALEPLSEVTQIVEGIAEGDLDQRRLAVDRADEIGRLGSSTNRMLAQLNALADQARKLADGRIDVLEVEEKVLRTERLGDADLQTHGKHGDLEASFIGMTNQLRRLTIQARMISKDKLDSPLLDQSVPGELGEAFGLMVRNLRTFADRAKQIADGDLTTRVEGDGELTGAFNQMVDGIKGLVEEITQTSIHISTAAEEILAVLRDQESAATHQASSVEETQRTMETLLSSAKKIADNAQNVFKSAEKTQDNNRTIAKRIGELKSHTERIAEILESIKSIADRSDLLALNASLEGMRAGEAGKGFTLVAAEMRRLAENIKESVGDIKELVEDIGESSMASAMATDEGSRLSERTTDNALKITLITQQQKSGTEQVTTSMDDLSELINQGVSGTQQVTMAASELVDLSENLRGLVDEFRISSNPASSAEYSAVTPRRSQRSGSFRSPKAADRTSGGLSASSSGAYDAISGEFDRFERRRSGDTGGLGRSSSAVEEDPSGKKTLVGLAASELGLERSSDIPVDSGAEQPTIEFATSMSEDEQRDVLREMLAEREADVDSETSEVALDAPDPDSEASLAEDSDAESSAEFDVDEDEQEPDDASVDDQIDALERELSKASEESSAEEDEVS